MFPGDDFVLEDLFVGDAAVETLGGEDAEFGLGEVEPRAMLWGVVPFEALDEPSGFGGREGLVERRLAVDVEVVLTSTMVLACAKWRSAKSFKTCA